MKDLKEAIHTALRDDSAATVGLRALLGHAATPFGVYQHHLPEEPDFATKSYLTWLMVGGTGGDAHGEDMRLREAVFSVTVWSQNPDTVEDALMRARLRLENLRGVTLPDDNIQLLQIKFEGHNADLFDDDFKAYYRVESYRAWYREDIVN